MATPAPISFTPYKGKVTVRHGGEVLAASTNALVLHETGLPDVFYIPRADVAMALFTRSDRVTHCPKKGDAAHWHAAAGDTQIENAAWSYETPIAQAEPIKEYFAFYPNKTDIEAE